MRWHPVPPCRRDHPAAPGGWWRDRSYLISFRIGLDPRYFGEMRPECGRGYACVIIATTEGSIVSSYARPPIKSGPAHEPLSARAVRTAAKLSDVAAAAGVAPMTVSRVLNTPERVSAA